MALASNREPVAAVIDDPATPTAVRDKLELSQRALTFAHTELGLPDNGSYETYVELGRDALVVNVFAAPALSLTPKTWCYPFVGCVAYRGYFARVDAERYAARLAKRGYDVITGDVPAYSTLGRFRDPIISTMLKRSDDSFVALLFHELAHQIVFVNDDTAFNESFATFVQRAGLERWREHNDQPVLPRTAAVSSRRQTMRELIENARSALGRIYASTADDDSKRQQKAAVFAQLEVDWRSAGMPGRAPHNNAALQPFALYDDLTPRFAHLFKQCEASFSCLYERVRELAELPREARLAAF